MSGPAPDTLLDLLEPRWRRHLASGESAGALDVEPEMLDAAAKAKRRLSAGEFATLHDAQLAIAREHGWPSWAALKEFIGDPANEHLHTVRLADDAVTVRELLSHTGGVDSPGELFADRVPGLASLAGPVLACGGPRGTFAYSHGGYAMLGQLIADVTGSPYADAAARLVTEPLGMASSSFPESWPDTAAITGCRMADDSTFEPAPAEVSTPPAAAGRRRPMGDRSRPGALRPRLGVSAPGRARARSAPAARRAGQHGRGGRPRLAAQLA
jgi:hypothetical protein